MGTPSTISLLVEDFTGQNMQLASNIPVDATVGDLNSALVQQLRLPPNDAQGRPITYAARAHRQSLLENDRVGDVLREGDVVTLTQNVTAG